MRRSDDVFFFTLIDFLLQVFFFGLLVFVVWHAQQQTDASSKLSEDEAKRKLMEGAGVSSIAELSDLLTKMVPLDQLRGTADYIAKSGGIGGIRSAVAAASAAGGSERVSQMDSQLKLLTNRVSELEGGWGKVSCVPNVVVNGKLQPKSIARVVVEDSYISLEDLTPEMMSLLTSLKLDVSSVQRMGLNEFRAAFSPLIAQKPECRYFLTAVTRTQFLAPMRSVWSAFRTQ